MPKIFFKKDSENELGSLIRIAEDELDAQHLNLDLNVHTVKDITEEDFNLVRLNEKEIISYTGNVVNFQIKVNLFNTREGLQRYIDDVSSLIEDNLIKNSNHPKSEKWIAYKNAIKSINVSSVITDGVEDRSEVLEGYDKELADQGKYKYPITGGIVLNSSLERYVENNFNGVSAIHPLQLI
jgi:hypothetical protein